MTEPRHGDPLDYADIPGDSGLSEEYRDSLRTAAMREAAAKRQAELAAQRTMPKAEEAAGVARAKSPK